MILLKIIRYLVSSKDMNNIRDSCDSCDSCVSYDSCNICDSYDSYDICVSCDKDILFFADLADESIDNELHEKIMNFTYEFKSAEFTVKKANAKVKNYISNLIARCKTSDLREIMFGYEDDAGATGTDDETDVRKIYMRRYPELYHTVRREEKGSYEKALFTEIIFSTYSLKFKYVAKDI
jgi:hypothetical protein